MKKVLHIFSEINYSGAELMWYSAIDILREKGYELELVSTGHNKGNFAYAFEEKGVKVHHVPIEKILPFLLKVNKLIRKIKPNALHIHPENKHLYFFYTIFGKLNNSKVIRTVHSMQNSKFPLARTVIRSLSNSFGCKFVSVSEGVYENELKLFNNITHLLNNWADDIKFKPVSQREKLFLRDKLKLPNDKILLLSVGNCAQIKNHKLIFDALCNLNMKYFYVHLGKEDNVYCHHLSRQLFENSSSDL